MHVDIELDEVTNQFVWCIESIPLIEEELKDLKIYKDSVEQKKFEETFDFSAVSQLWTFRTNIPIDGQVEDLVRLDHDTGVGGLVELIIPKKKKLNKLSLKAKRFTHLQTTVQTSVPLLIRNEEDQK